MATTTIEQPPQLAPTVLAALDALRARVRWYVWMEGIATGLTWLGVAFWVSLAIDWFFEPIKEVRGAMLAVAALVLLGILVQLILRRAFVPLSHSNMATVLERRFRTFDDSLLTAVVLTARQLDPAKCNPEMLERTCLEAADRIGSVRLRQVFNPVPLWRSICGAVLFATSIAMFAGLFPDAMGIWARRNLVYLFKNTDELWPRTTRLEVEGFPDGVMKVARGSDVDIVARAYTQDADGKRLVVPEAVKIRYWIEGGGKGTAMMSREGNADPDSDPFQKYSYTVKGLLASHRLEVVGGDDRVRDLHIEVVDNPTISRMWLDCRYPAYMGRADQSLPVTGVMQIRYGARVTVHADANKELHQVQIDVTGGGQSSAPQYLAGEQLGADGRGFACRIRSLRGDTTLLFSLTDTDGIRGQQSVPLSLAVVADEPPQLAVRLDGIGSAITPAARLPVVGKIADDNGIAKVWAEASVDQNELPRQIIAVPARHPTDLELADAALEARELKLSPGQKLLLSVKAADLYDLGSGPNVGTSERWLLDVVTPEQLRAMLEARELVLRQRFERIIQEMIETRDLVARVDFTSPGSGQSGDKSSDEGAVKPAGKEKAADKKTGSEPDDEPRDQGKELSPERQLAMRVTRVEQALQNGRKNSQEVLGVAESFDDIRKQLVNNGIDTEELKMRLEGKIAKPLHHVAEQMFPELEQRLQRLQEVIGDPESGARRRDQAQQQAEDILASMRQVLDQMLEMEDYNELVETLRTIIKQQDKINELTKQRHKLKIRDLKED